MKTKQDIPTLLNTLFQVVAIAEQRGDRLEEEGEQLGDIEEVQLEMARKLLRGMAQR